MPRPYELTFEERPDYLYVCVRAQIIDLEVAILYIDEMMMHLSVLGWDRVLFVRDTPMMASDSHYAIVGNTILNMLPVDIKFAFVDKSPSRELVQKTAEAAAARRNLHLRTFDTVEEAEQWLIAGEAEESQTAGCNGEPNSSLAA